MSPSVRKTLFLSVALGLLGVGCDQVASPFDAGVDAEVPLDAEAPVDGAADLDAQADLDAGIAGCAEVVAEFVRCYPDLVVADCTEETLARYEGLDLSSMTCAELDALGESGMIEPGVCGAGRHVCNGVFCCGDYPITRDPEASDWDIVALIDDYQSSMPADVADELMGATIPVLTDGMSWDWEQELVGEVGGTAIDMAVELTVLYVDVDYDMFVTRLPTQRWGPSLNRYLGGETRIYEEDTEGRAVRQAERMVLSPFPLSVETRLSNQDMTKSEVIHYFPARSKVYWRVYFSDNDSTEADVGSVEFRALGAGTLITFHSAHRLNGPLGVHLSNRLVRLTLGSFFMAHATRYRDLVGG